jgi:hypothetical protein
MRLVKTAAALAVAVVDTDMNGFLDGMRCPHRNGRRAAGDEISVVPQHNSA